MSWIRTLIALNKARKAKFQFDRVKKINDLGENVVNVDEKKLTKEMLGYFDDHSMDEVMNLSRIQVRASQKAERAKLELPKCDSLKAFMVAMNAAGKFGVNSPQAKKALEKYVFLLQIYALDLLVLVDDLKAVGKHLPKDRGIVMRMAGYTRALEKTFARAMRIPSVYGTAQNATFLGLLLNAEKYNGMLTAWNISLLNLEKKNTAHIRDVQEIIKLNKLWLVWATSSKSDQDGAMKKNAKAKKPK